MIQKGLYTTDSNLDLLFDMSTPFNILTLIFPAIMSFISIFFLYHGIKRLSASQLTGIVKSKTPGKDHRDNNCIYNRLEVDYFIGGHQEWKQLYSEEQRLQFSLNDTIINLDSTDIRLKPNRVTIGYINYEKGGIEKFFDGITFQVSKNVDKTIKDSPLGTIADFSQKNFIDEGTTKILLTIPKLKKTMVPHIRKQFRITEYILAPGTRVSLGISGSHNNVLLRPFLITDQKGENVTHLIREKSYMTIFIGAAFTLLSLGVFLIIILSF